MHDPINARIYHEFSERFYMERLTTFTRKMRIVFKNWNQFFPCVLLDQVRYVLKSGLTDGGKAFLSHTTD